MQLSFKEYYKYLNGYRFIAVLFVILTHWLPSYFEKLPLSKLGVDMFFVLSGFLITEILMLQKKEYSTSGGSRWTIYAALSTFYGRRTLRIFPIYYLSLLFFVLINTHLIKNNSFYFLFYLTNYFIIAKGEWIGMFSHLWSLAVEEQFYLIWPFIILATPLRFLKPVLLSVVAISFFYIVCSSHWKTPFFAFNTVSCVSTLGGGALLAFSKVKGTAVFNRARFDYPLFFVSAFFIFLQVINYLDNYVLLHFSMILFAFIFIKILITRNNRYLDCTFGNRYISFLGKVSYGLYLYHSFVPWLLRNFTGEETRLKFIEDPFIAPVRGGLQLLFWHFFLLLLLASVSWFAIEKPINKLKKYFQSPA